MRPTVPHRWLKVALVAAGVLLVDQLTKRWAVETLGPPPSGEGQIVDVIWTLRFRYAENTGMAFSQGAQSGRWIALVVMAIVVAMVVIAARATTTTQVLLIGVVIGGALGNLSDRLFRATQGFLSGAVVDFIDLQWWPVFNVADAAVVLGGIALVWFGTRESPPDQPVDDGPSIDDDRAVDDGRPVDDG
jgi:signal peptidase II